MAGSKHHHKTYVNRYHIGYFGKKGMRYFHKLKNRFYCPIINIEKLWNLINKNIKKEFPLDKINVPIIDVTKFGFFKVLSKGMLPKQPIIVRANFLVRRL